MALVDIEASDVRDLVVFFSLSLCTLGEVVGLYVLECSLQESDDLLS